jgi:hypothetical protein
MKNTIIVLICFVAYFFASCGTEKAAGKKIFVLQKIHEGAYYDLPSGVPELETKLQKRIAQLGIAEEDIGLLAVQGKLHLEISQWSIYKKTVDAESIRKLITSQGVFSVWKTASAKTYFDTLVNHVRVPFKVYVPELNDSVQHFRVPDQLRYIVPPFYNNQEIPADFDFAALQINPFLTIVKAEDTLIVRKLIDSLQIIGAAPTPFKFAWKTEKGAFALTILSPTIPDGYVSTAVISEIKTFHGNDSLALLFNDKTAANWRRMVQKRKNEPLAFLFDREVIGTVDGLTEKHTESISFANTLSQQQLQLIKIVIEYGALEYPLRIVTESEF